MMDIVTYCKYLFDSLYIPIYIYNNKTLSDCFPAQDENPYEPTSYLSYLWEANKAITYTTTPFYSFYGCVQVANTDSCIVLGPVSSLPYTKDTLLAMGKEFSIKGHKAEEFSNFFCNIPTQNLDPFINILLSINYTLNHTELTRKDVVHSVDSLSNISIHKKYSENTFNAKEEGIINNSYAIECELLRYVETGNIEGLRKFENHARYIKTGVVASDNIRQLKNLVIVTIVISCRAAIKGGLSPNIAFELSDIYIQQLERLSNVDEITSLMNRPLYDFTNRVANSVIPTNTDNILNQAVQYVRSNTNSNITVSDVADYVGFSRCHLSHKFKSKLGFELSSFIRLCKLEEGKDLLAYSDKSISEISNYLCFSSQSHFQKAFKNQFGITPQTYRNANRIL